MSQVVLIGAVLTVLLALLAAFVASLLGSMLLAIHSLISLQMGEYQRAILEAVSAIAIPVGWVVALFVLEVER